MDVLIRFEHGLGDSVQLTCILKHIRKYRPDWKLYLRALRGKHSVGYYYCEQVWHDQHPEQPKDEDFDRVFDLPFYENYCAYTDCQCSKVTNTLREIFQIEPDQELMRYGIWIRPPAEHTACRYLQSVGCKLNARGAYNAVCMHYEGNTSSDKKNLRHWHAAELCQDIIAAGRVPIILDWDRRSPLPDHKTIFNPNQDNELWGGTGTGDAETICALISQCEAFIGIDSGPGKVASATETPTLICWTGHHPMHFHEPASNTLHLIPQTHRDMSPINGNVRRAEWFDDHYAYQTYLDEFDMLTQARNWLAGKLDSQRTESKQKAFVLPNGIGDSMWALHKIKAVAGNQPIDIVLSGDPNREIDHRAVPFLKRFPFVRSVSVNDVPVLVDRRNPADSAGRYRYVTDGERGQFYFLVPNATLEAGKRLEKWLPQYPMDWGVIDELSLEGTEKGEEQASIFEPFVAFYLGSETGNVDEGHNRGFLWEPKHWVELGKEFIERELNIVLVGAEYDRSYWEKYVRPGVRENGMNWEDRIGSFEIGDTLALLKKAKLFVSYQCGLGIVAHYLGVRVAMWWRPEGDSIHREQKICFDERMAHSWTNPKYRDRYVPLIYKRETPQDVIREMDRRGWLPPCT